MNTPEFLPEEDYQALIIKQAEDIYTMDCLMHLCEIIKHEMGQGDLDYWVFTISEEEQEFITSSIKSFTKEDHVLRKQSALDR